MLKVFLVIVCIYFNRITIRCIEDMSSKTFGVFFGVCVFFFKCCILKKSLPKDIFVGVCVRERQTDRH